MREILFKGQDIHSGEEFQGAYRKTPGFYYFTDGHKAHCDGICLIIDKDNVEHPVAERTVRQWTGLNDLNGVKIWEGDTVREYDDDTINDYSVMWDCKSAAFILIDNPDSPMISTVFMDGCEYEVLPGASSQFDCAKVL